MNTDKDVKLFSADDDPVTDVESTGTSINLIDDEDDPSTDVDLTGTSISSITEDDYIYTDNSANIDLMSEGAELESHYAFSTGSYQDPLGDVDIGDADDTGICLRFLDTDYDFEEPEYDVDVTGRGIEKIFQK